MNRASFAGDLQSISWMAMALGGICGSLLGGYALASLQIDKIFLLFSVLPTIQLFSCGLVGEKSVDEKILPESSPNGSNLTNGNGFHENKFSSLKSKTSTSRRKKGQNTSTKAPRVTSRLKTPEKDVSFASKWYQSLKMACYSLFDAFRQPIILR